MSQCWLEVVNKSNLLLVVSKHKLAVDFIGKWIATDTVLFPGDEKFVSGGGHWKESFTVNISTVQTIGAKKEKIVKKFTIDRVFKFILNEDSTYQILTIAPSEINLPLAIRASMEENWENMNYYETLQIPRTATNQEIRVAYYKLAKKYHPDRNKSPEAKYMFERISEAYITLSDEEIRKKYDVELSLQSTMTKSYWRQTLLTWNQNKASQVGISLTAILAGSSIMLLATLGGPAILVSGGLIGGAIMGSGIGGVQQALSKESAKVENTNWRKWKKYLLWYGLAGGLTGGVTAGASLYLVPAFGGGVAAYAASGAIQGGFAGICYSSADGIVSDRWKTLLHHRRIDSIVIDLLVGVAAGTIGGGISGGITGAFDIHAASVLGAITDDLSAATKGLPGFVVENAVDLSKAVCKQVGGYTKTAISSAHNAIDNAYNLYEVQAPLALGHPDARNPVMDMLLQHETLTPATVPAATAATIAAVLATDGEQKQEPGSTEPENKTIGEPENKLFSEPVETTGPERVAQVISLPVIPLVIAQEEPAPRPSEKTNTNTNDTVETDEGFCVLSSSPVKEEAVIPRLYSPKPLLESLQVIEDYQVLNDVKVVEQEDPAKNLQEALQLVTLVNKQPLLSYLSFSNESKTKVRMRVEFTTESEGKVKSESWTFSAGEFCFLPEHSQNIQVYFEFLSPLLTWKIVKAWDRILECWTKPTTPHILHYPAPTTRRYLISGTTYVYISGILDEFGLPVGDEVN